MKKDPSSAVRSENRRLAAIMFTDIVGFSRQMGSNEARTLRLLDTHNQIIQQAVADHHGTVIKTVGDAFLVDFPSVVNAVQCAQHVQAQLRTHNHGKDPAEQIHVRIGIHLGDVVRKDGDVFGDGVNIASRLQTLAEPDTICISDMVFRDVASKLDLGTMVPLGKPKLKNIAERLHVYGLLCQSPRGWRQTLRVQGFKLRSMGDPVHRTAAAIVLLALVSVGAFALRERYFPPSPALPLPDKPSIVVLPFTNMSGDPEQEYFSDGLTEDLTSDLSKLSGLFVIARNSAFTYKGKAVKVQEVSREVGVRYVLEGSVRKAGDQVRVTTQLIDATTGGHLWAERYDRPLQDIFALQDEIVQQIVANLRIEVIEAELERIRRIPTENLNAYDYSLRGLESFGRAFEETKKELNEQAQQMFEKALELDPQYALAYAWLGWTYWLDWVYGWNPNRAQSLERAFEVAQKAAALDDSLSASHRVLSQVYLWKKQHDQAIIEGERVIALDPNFADGYAGLGVILIAAGRPEKGIGLLEKAIRLNPRSPAWYLMNSGAAYCQVGRHEEALLSLKRALALNPNIVHAHIALAACYAELGRLEEARAEVAETLRLQPNFSLEVTRQGFPSKDPADLERLLAALRKAGLK